MNDIPSTKAIIYGINDNKDGRYRKPVNHTVNSKLQPTNER